MGKSNVHINKMKRKRNLSCVLISFLIVSSGCGGNNKKISDTTASDTTAIPDTLHAVTLYGPTSYFNYRGQEMGFDYENLKQFAQDEGYVLDLKIASSLKNLLEMVTSGEADLAAYPIPLIDEYKELVTHCGHKEITWQVLVQPQSDSLINDVTQLVGKVVYVEKDSKYHYRINNLNQELGGGIKIVPIDKDTLMTEDMIEMVDKREIPLTIVDSDIAALNHSYFPHLDVSLKVGLDQYSSWAVRKDCTDLAEELENWGKRKETSETMKSVYRKYFEMSKESPLYDTAGKTFGLNLKKGDALSPYDNLFKRHSSTAGFDWQLLAAIGFNESRFKSNIVSWAGARGVMQLMPATARAMGVSNLETPDNNILAAARLLKKLDESLESRVPDDKERMKFVVASYNCGLGHVYDAIALAEKYGLNPKIWTGNVSEAALMKSRPQYYNDPVVRNGYFRGRETVDFVDRVMNVYEYYKEINNS